MDPVGPKPLAVAIGERVRAIREERRLRQEDLARAARGVGFRWTRTVVAKLEAGRRNLSGAELLCLPYILNAAVDFSPPVDDVPAVVELGELFPDSEWIAVTTKSRISGRALRMLARGTLGDVLITDVDTPARRAEYARTRQMSDRIHRMPNQRIRRAIWPEARILEFIEAVRDAAGDAEQKAAHRLGIPVFAIALEARRRWHQSLSAERDRRLTVSATGTLKPRTQQALRGHISRALLRELEDLPARLRAANVLQAKREHGRPPSRRSRRNARAAGQRTPVGR